MKIAITTLLIGLSSVCFSSETRLFTGRFTVNWCGFDKTINKNKCLLENKEKNIYVSAYFPINTPIEALSTYSFTGALDCTKVKEPPAAGMLYGRTVTICNTDKIRMTDCEIQILEMTKKHCQIANIDPITCRKQYNVYKNKYCGRDD